MSAQRKTTARTSHSDFNTTKRLLTVQELAERLNISPGTIYNWISKGSFPIRVRRIGRLVRFSREDVEHFLNGL